MRSSFPFFPVFPPFKLTAKWIFILLSGLIAIWMLWVSKDYGITWDEWEHAMNGSFSLRYLLGDAKDLSFLNHVIAQHFCEPIYLSTGVVYGLLHGSVLDFARHGLMEGQNLQDFFALAHHFTAAVGFLAILFTGLLAKELGNWKTGILALSLIFLSPRFLGNCMNNPKDIPLAGMYVCSFYFMIRWIKTLPHPPLRLSAILTFSITAGIWARSGALILIPYLFFFSFAYGLYKQWTEKIPADWMQIAGWTSVVAVLGYAGGSILWPYAQQNPLINPLKSLLAFSHFTLWDNAFLFEGNFIKPSELPWYYLPKWILISSPLFFVSGLCFLMFFVRRLIKTFSVFFLSMTFVGALFPLLAVILRRSIVYDSWRHVLFIYPLWIVLISLALQTAWAMAVRSRTRILFAIFFLIQVAEPAIWIVKNHPNEYVYFNDLVGGLRGALSQYETDYWGSALRNAAEWLAAYHSRNAPGQRLLVRADGSVMSSYPFLYKQFGEAYRQFGYPESFLKKNPAFSIVYAPLFLPQIAFNQPWDYALVLPRGWPSLEIKTHWPPPGTIYEVKTDGVTLCAVVKNPLKK